MSLALSSRRAALMPGQWVRNELWRRAKAVPSLDLRFAENKSLVDATTGQSLVTFTRASSGTYVGSDGLIKTAITNLLLQSNTFNTTWTTTNCTVTSAAGIVPDGTNTAWQFKDTVDASPVLHALAQASISATSGNSYTFSIFAKTQTIPRITLVFPAAIVTTATQSVFDLTTGTVFFTGTNSTTSITSFGNGWYRCSMTMTATATATGAFTTRLADGTGVSYQGTGNGSILIYGAQLEQSSTVGEYIPTTSTINSAPRFDHNPTTGESLGLLVEEQRTNSIRNNTMVGAVAGTPGTLPTNWAIGNAGTLSTSIIGTGTESGITYVDLQISGTSSTGGPRIRFEALDSITAASGQTWTGSVYLRQVGGSTTNITSLTVDVFTRDTAQTTEVETFAGSNITSLGVSSIIRSRSTVSGTLANASSTRVCSRLTLNCSSGVAIDITLRIGLPQLEQGAFATSVIPTTTATVTRNADVASITGTNFSSWYRQDEGTVFAELAVAQPNVGGNQFVFRVGDNTYNNAIALNIPGAAQLSTASGGVFDGSASSVASLVANVTAKTASAYLNNNLGISLNGATAVIDTSATIPLAITRADIGSDHLGLNRVKAGTIKRLCFWPARLANSTLQAITR